MDFSLTEEQEMLKKTARDFLEKECPESIIRETEEGDICYSPKLWRKIADMGWLGLIYPEKYGGTANSFMDLAVLYEEMGRVMFPSPHLSTVVLCGLPILMAGSERQKSEILPKIVSGEKILALAFSEPESSWGNKAWDAEGITMQAVAEGNNYVINGTKLFVHDANIADYFLCVARTKVGTSPDDGVTLFLVEARRPDISCKPLRTMAGDKQCEVVFNKTKVSAADIVGELHKGWMPLSRALQMGAVLLCAEMVGAGQKLLEITVDYAKTRVQFDQPIGVNQYMQDHCVYLLTEVNGSRWLTQNAAYKLSQGLPCDIEVATAKAWTSDSHERACWRAHQVHAGIGYTIDAGLLPLFSRRGKIQQLYLGDSAYHLEKMAKEMDKWLSPEKPKGKPLGLWGAIPEEDRVPAWEPWRKRWEAIQKRKVELKRR